MKRSTFKVLFYLKRSDVKKSGMVPIVSRITINGKLVQFNTKLETLPENWSVESGKVIGRNKESIKTNQFLEDIKSTINRIYHEQMRKDVNVTAESVKNEYLGLSVNHETLLDLFKKHNDDVLKLIGISKSKATYQKYEVTRKHIETFLFDQYRLSDISLKEINHMFISDLEVYFMTTGKCSPNTTAKFIQFFKRIILIARNNGWIHTDPFANYKIRLKKVDRGYLTQEEIELILQKKFASERLEQVRDIFIFSCFTGLAYIDVKNLSKENIRTSFDGNMWIMTKRTKTDTTVTVPLMNIPSSILEKYKDQLPQGKILPMISNQKMNAYLKEIGDVCGINKNLTFHLARHTFATSVTLAKGVPIETVSKMLGHTNIKTTQIYARITDSKIGNDMAALAGKLKGMDDVYNMANSK